MSQTQIPELQNLTTYTLVDVRTPEEVAEESYPNAIHIPLDQVMDRVEEFKQMTPPIVVFCRSGHRSGNVKSYLDKQNIGPVINGINIETLKAHF